MKELNLEVGQKVWTIQCGYCQLMEIDKDAEYCFITRDKDGRRNCYNKFGKYGDNHEYPSLFESNPLENHIAPNHSVETNDMVKSNIETNKTWRSPVLGENEVGFLTERHKPSDFINLEEQELNKAEMINALCFVIDTNATTPESKLVAQEKLDKYLESL